ncbi:MAG: MOSC domain-containing protein [Parasphingorhabdus sp.]
MINTILDTVLIGTPQPFREDGEQSAIAKKPVAESIFLGELGLAGNEVADTIHHGGRDKAIHLYPLEHYAFWREKYPDVEVLNCPGAFGENFSCTGMIEDELCLGDIFQVGDARIQASHARSPCWKLNHRFGKPDVMKTVIKTTKSGSYFRVLDSGMVRVGDMIEQIECPFPDWPLSKVFRLVIGGHHKTHRDEMDFLSQNEALAESWRQRSKQLFTMS